MRRELALSLLVGAAQLLGTAQAEGFIPEHHWVTDTKYIQETDPLWYTGLNKLAERKDDERFVRLAKKSLDEDLVDVFILPQGKQIVQNAIAILRRQYEDGASLESYLRDSSKEKFIVDMYNDELARELRYWNTLNPGENVWIPPEKKIWLRDRVQSTIDKYGVWIGELSYLLPEVEE